MRLAIITARGGSKRILRKNVRPFAGQPIIAYSIRAALASGCFDEVTVSTDDAEIADVSRRFGASVPFMRSAETSSDSATTSAVLVEVLEEYGRQASPPEFACCIYPAAPLITADSLREGLKMLLANPGLAGVIPVARFSFPIQRALRIADGLVSPFEAQHVSTRSQDLEPAYHDAGQFYWIRVSDFLPMSGLITPRTGALVLPEWQVQDIDTEDDWIMAEMKYRLLQDRRAPRT